MRYLFFLILFFSFAASSAEELFLKEKLAEAEAGSWMVLQQKKNFTLIHIYERTSDKIILEEVSIPLASFQRQRTSWKCWFESGALGHTSWMLSQIDLQTARFEQSYSFTQKKWVDLSQSDTFLTTLLNLPFRPVPEKRRRRLGAGSLRGQRPLWQPRLVVEGQQIEGVSFTSWIAKWPADGSDLARKHLEIYIPESQNQATYPSYFPYWIEVDNCIGNARVRVVDSGLNARSPKTNLPTSWLDTPLLPENKHELVNKLTHRP